MTSYLQRQQRIWGIAMVHNGKLAVAEKDLTYEEAEQIAERQPTVTISGDHPDTGDRHTLNDVWPVVYQSDTDLDTWILSAVGWPIKDVTEVKIGRSPVLVTVDGPGQITTRNPARA
jgi:hypothetical protein